jgi:hypothetical protein
MAPSNAKSLQDVRNGALLQMAEAATLGLPFEVWKTRMGRFRSESNVVAFRAVYDAGGRGLSGVRAFWAGFTPKMVESASKGAVLMVAKEGLKDLAGSAGINPFLGALLAGAGGGVCQTVVMGPCTYLVTAAVTGGSGGAASKSTTELVRSTYARSGLRGFYPGGSAIAVRQATNWASRQGITEGLRIRLRKVRYGDESAKLAPGEEIGCGVIGGALSCWNHPIEVARIEMQARANAGESSMSILQVFRLVVSEHGLPGLFKGVLPRVGLGIWQTLFMVSSVHIIGSQKK